VPTGTVKLSPPFVAFFSRAMQLSDALFAEDPNKVQITFNVEVQLPEGATAATLVLDGVQIRSGQNLAQRRIIWPSPTGGDSRVSALVRGTELTGPSITGAWSSLQLFQTAEWRPENDGWRLEWRTGGHNADGSPLRIAVRLSAANPANVATIFRRPPPSGACTGSIAQ
jgi:type VI protein secretion system component VasK